MSIDIRFEILFFIVHLDSDNDDETTPIPTLTNDSQLSEDSSENFRLQKAG